MLFKDLGLPQPVKYGKGKTVSTAQDVLEGLAENHECSSPRARIPPSIQAEVDLRRFASIAC